MSKSLDYYLSLTYPVQLIPEAEGGYTVLIPNLPGCMTTAETVQEALEKIEDARRLWIQVAWEHDQPIPEPLEGP